MGPARQRGRERTRGRGETARQCWATAWAARRAAAGEPEERSWAGERKRPSWAKRRERSRPSGGEEKARLKKTVGQKARLAQFFPKFDFPNTFSNGF